MRPKLSLVPYVLFVLVLAAAPAVAQIGVSTPDGSATLRLGLLAHAQGEWLDNPDGESTAQNLFLRRMRLLAGGKIGDRFTFFLDTDNPNLGKAGADGRRSETSIYLQDLVLTYAVSPQWKVDAGKLLVANSYNSGQSAGSLLGIDYGPYGFVSSAPMGMQGGRDYGVACRGYLLSNHLEVRAGVYQGVRGHGARNPLRTAARAAWYPFEAHTDFYYPGTSLGRKKVVAFGLTHDRQRDYRASGGDIYVDLPLGQDAVTFQVNVVRFDGGELMPALVEQDTLFIEAGYFKRSIKLTPFVQFSERDRRQSGAGDERTVLAGVAYWLDGHRLNLKAGAGRITATGAPDRSQVVVQAQVFLY